MRAVALALLLVGCGSGDKPVAAPVANTAPPVAAKPDGPLQTCFCASWVHLDENGTDCQPTLAACEQGVKERGRDSTPCAEEKAKHCGGHACRNIGAECFKLH